MAKAVTQFTRQSGGKSLLSPILLESVLINSIDIVIP